MIPEVCVALAVYLNSYYPLIAKDLTSKLTESQCVEYNEKVKQIRVDIIRARTENTPEALRQKGYVVCEKKGEYTACK